MRGSYLDEARYRVVTANGIEDAALGLRSDKYELEQLYRSPNGDTWLLACDHATGLGTVRHQANASSGGQMTDVDIGAFLSGPRHPEQDALLRLKERRFAAPLRPTMPNTSPRLTSKLMSLLAQNSSGKQWRGRASFPPPCATDCVRLGFACRAKGRALRARQHGRSHTSCRAPRRGSRHRRPSRGNASYASDWIGQIPAEYLDSDQRVPTEARYQS